MLDRLLERLFARNHKVCFRVLCLCLSASFLWPSCYLCALAFANCYQVLIFSQWTKVLDIMDYYFSEKGFEVCRIDGSVKLDDRKRQVCTNAWITQLLIIHLKLLLLICFVFGFEYEINNAQPFMIFIIKNSVINDNLRICLVFFFFFFKKIQKWHSVIKNAQRFL